MTPMFRTIPTPTSDLTRRVEVDAAVAAWLAARSDVARATAAYRLVTAARTFLDATDSPGDA